MAANIDIISVFNMSQLVENAFKDCLDEDRSDNLKIEGIRTCFWLNPQRLEENRKLVTELLEELPTKFREKNGDSFLHFCHTKTGQLWTGEHKVCEQLLVMALGLDLMAYYTPVETWHLFPGGLPYVIIK